MIVSAATSMTASAAVARSIPGRWRKTPDTSPKTSATATPEWSSAVTMPRISAMSAAAATPWPVTSPTTSAILSAVEEKAFVPVAADRVRLARWEIASRELDSGHGGKGAQQAPMQLDDELVFGVVALGALDGGGAQVRDGVERALQLCVERCRLGPCEADRTDQRAVLAMQRHRCSRLDASGDRVGEDLGKLRTVGGKVREQHCVAGASRRGDRERCGQRDVCVPVRELGREEGAMEQPQRFSGRVEHGHVGVVSTDAGCGTKRDVLRDLPACGGQRERSGKPSGHLDADYEVNLRSGFG